MKATLVPAVLSALRTAVRARLGTVRVSTVALGPTGPSESVVFARATSESQWAALGKEKREERFVIEGVVRAHKPGTDEASGDAVIARVSELLEAVAEECGGRKPAVADVYWSELIVPNWIWGQPGKGSFSEAQFQIRVRSRLQ